MDWDLHCQRRKSTGSKKILQLFACYPIYTSLTQHVNHIDLKHLVIAVLGPCGATIVCAQDEQITLCFVCKLRICSACSTTGTLSCLPPAMQAYTLDCISCGAKRCETWADKLRYTRVCLRCCRAALQWEKEYRLWHGVCNQCWTEGPYLGML
ncbi:hypothetical protein BGX38DRAFT_1213162 [Terfezia claveryi]|nr:hypothetical protein BGX38DRAFT_1213162 [Terfezia claveryi]